MTGGWWTAVVLIGGVAVVLLANHCWHVARRNRQIPPSDCRNYGATSSRPAHDAFCPDSLDERQAS